MPTGVRDIPRTHGFESGLRSLFRRSRRLGFSGEVVPRSGEIVEIVDEGTRNDAVLKRDEIERPELTRGISGVRHDKPGVTRGIWGTTRGNLSEKANSEQSLTEVVLDDKEGDQGFEQDISDNDGDIHISASENTNLLKSKNLLSKEGLNSLYSLLEKGIDKISLQKYRSDNKSQFDYLYSETRKPKTLLGMNTPDFDENELKSLTKKMDKINGDKNHNKNPTGDQLKVEDGMRKNEITDQSNYNNHYNIYSKKTDFLDAIAKQHGIIALSDDMMAPNDSEYDKNNGNSSSNDNNGLENDDSMLPLNVEDDNKYNSNYNNGSRGNNNYNGNNKINNNTSHDNNSIDGYDKNNNTSSRYDNNNDSGNDNHKNSNSSNTAINTIYNISKNSNVSHNTIQAETNDNINDIKPQTDPENEVQELIKSIGSLKTNGNRISDVQLTKLEDTVRDFLNLKTLSSVKQTENDGKVAAFYSLTFPCNGLSM